MKMKNFLVSMWNWLKRLFKREEKTYEEFKKKMTFKEWRAYRKAHTVPRFKQSCKYCKKSMWVSVGQRAFWHKSCRTEGRQLYAKIA